MNKISIIVDEVTTKPQKLSNSSTSLSLSSSNNSIANDSHETSTTTAAAMSSKEVEEDDDEQEKTTVQFLDVGKREAVGSGTMKINKSLFNRNY